MRSSTAEEGRGNRTPGLSELWERFRTWRERRHLKPAMSVLIYIIAPLIAINLIMAQYPLLDKARFHNILTWTIPLGLALFAVSILQERYKKGTRARLGLDAVFVGLSMGWLFGLLGGSGIIHSDYAGWGFSVDVRPLLTIILIGTGLNFIRDLLEYQAYREGEGIAGAGGIGDRDSHAGDGSDDMVTIITSEN